MCKHLTTKCVVTKCVECKQHFVTDDKDDLRTIKSPHKCPVCEGIGSREAYKSKDGVLIPVKCHACEGKGVLWG